MIENGTLLQNRYLIEKQIGAGGMGAVYLAVDQRFDNPVAIKETFYKDQKLSEAFEREARLLNNLQHSALPHVSDYFAEADGYFIVMQFIEGKDLSDILKREGAFPVADVLRWTDNLLDALDYLHSQDPPIIHRDIKPHNLKLTPRGDIVLLDFGLAKLNSEDTTGALSVFGYSRTYSPLEQIQGTGTDARSDIFALGATAYHLLTGKPPADALARAASIVNGKSDPLKTASEMNDKVPVDLANVLNSALALNPDQRFASAKAMRQALAHAVILHAPEVVEELPEEQIAVVAPAAAIVNSAETENFPALEAFAAEVAIDSSETSSSEKLPVKILQPNAQASAPAPKHYQDTTAVVDAKTQVSVRRAKQKPSPLLLAAIAAALICAVSAALYSITKTNPALESNESPVAESTPVPETINETTAAILISPTPLLEATKEPKVKPVSIEPIVEKRKTAIETTVQNENAETAEKPKASIVVETKRPPAPPVPRRRETQSDGETRTRVVEQSPVADIESIFTGQPAKKSEYKEQRRREREQMSDEELRQVRRERREKRRERQDRQDYPPF